MEIETTASRIVYENKWTRLREDEILHADGSPGIFAVIEKPDFAVVIPVTDTGFWLVEQYRHPVQGRYLEFPMGANEAMPEMPAEELARQELAEETGFQAKALTEIGQAFLAYGLANHGFHVFVATDLRDGEPNRSTEEQGMRNRHVTRAEFEELALAGEIKDSATLTAYAILSMRERRGEVRIGSTPT